ncbi:hypothetical protein CHARACLAT_015370 [Characodon lateralis]|uniref:Uncharacterized protein n=1 Tax=Characodon lateralis TaxID=208331 RepID=A0ABU7CRI0_9TELE|nr:hypothetical protein [Characodon lateralis]
MFSAGLGTPWAPPGGAGRGVWGEGRLGVSAESAAPATQSRIKRKMTSTSTSSYELSPIPALRLLAVRTGID